MQLKYLLTAIVAFFQRWFHKRNIIIVSDQKVKHISISASMQVCAAILVLASIGWASYFTGGFIITRSVLNAQSQTLRSVASARVETTFKPLFQVAPSTAAATQSAAAPVVASLSDPMFTLSALEQNKLYGRIAFLEHQISQLKNNNEAIIQRMSDKTTGTIADIESIIRQTGLRPEDLKKQASDDKSRQHASPADQASNNAEGGPYIPAQPIDLSPQEDALYNNLDRLAMLRQIVSNLPLAKPIRNAEEHSRFGHRIDPFNGHLAFHSGLDLAGPMGSQIYSTADGKVVFAGPNGGYGNCIDIDHGYGVVTRYGHLSSILVKEGQTVRRGDVIAIEGSTGRSTGPHLHYEVRYHDQPMNPENFLHAGQYVSQE